jgi:hypothetical protein
MKREIINMTIEDVHKKRDQFTFPDYQREPKIWPPKSKQLLIDSILRDIDIPKLYLFKENVGKTYDVVDGQQRLWAIWEFLDGEYGYEANGVTKKFNELDKSRREKILTYLLQFTLITDADDEYLRELFLRLQLGLLLKSGEKLNALVGSMRDFVFQNMKQSKFIGKVNIPARRYAKETLCAQIAINSFSKETIGEFSRTRFEDLKYFFDNYQKLSGNEEAIFKKQTKTILSTLQKLNDSFGDRADGLRNRSLILSIYLFVEELFETENETNFVKTMPKFVTFILKFAKRLREEAKEGFRRKNEELYNFGSFLSNAPGEKYQIANRHVKLKEFFGYYLANDNKIKGDK